MGRSLNNLKFGSSIGRFPSNDAASMAVKGLTSTETIRLIRDGEKGGKGVRRWRERQIIYISSPPESFLH